MFQPLKRLPQLTSVPGRRAYHKPAIGHGFRYALAFFRVSEQRGGADRRARLAKCNLVRIYNPEVEKAEITHGARGGADVEGIPRGYQDDAAEFSGNRQQGLFSHGSKKPPLAEACSTQPRGS